MAHLSAAANSCGGGGIEDADAVADASAAEDL